MSERKKKFRRLKRVALIVACLLALLGFSGCQSISYYRQAIKGQYEIVAHRQSIKDLLADSRTPAALKAKLELVLRLREFAERELDLPANGHYLRYVHLNRPYVVWNVHAAPECSFEPKTWWYPIVGRLKYRGYFSEADARRYANALEKQGLEVYVEGVEAYSTLGWFRDPVLSTFIQHEETALAEIIFHELAHQRVFAHGDTDFDEAFATAVAEEGVRRWLQVKNDAMAYDKYRIAHQRYEQFVRLILESRRELEAVYAGQKPPESNSSEGGHEQSLGTVRSQKQAVLAKLRQRYALLKTQWGGGSGYDAWFGQALNNAQLNTVATYEELVPAFASLLEVNGGDLEKFYQEAQRLAKTGKEKRVRQLRELANRAPGEQAQSQLGHAGSPAADSGSASGAAQ